MADETYTKADLDAAIASAIEEAVGPLKKKNGELMDELKTAKRGKQVDPAEVEKLNDQIDELRDKLTTAEKSAKDALKAQEKAEGALKTESAFTQKLLIQDGLKTALIANGVKDEDFIDSLTAKFMSGASVVVDGETRKAMLGDKPMADAIKEWAGSDAGKKFVAAAVNSGGGAPGGTKGETGKTMLRSAFDALAPAEQHAFTVKDGGKVVDQAA